jgi:hypothetical protein
MADLAEWGFPILEGGRIPQGCGGIGRSPAAPGREGAPAVIESALYFAMVLRTSQTNSKKV